MNTQLTDAENLIQDAFGTLFVKLMKHPEYAQGEAMDVALKMASCMRSIIEEISDNKLSLCLVLTSEKPKIDEWMKRMAEQAAAPQSKTIN